MEVIRQTAQDVDTSKKRLVSVLVDYDSVQNIEGAPGSRARAVNSINHRKKLRLAYIANDLARSAVTKSEQLKGMLASAERESEIAALSGETHGKASPLENQLAEFYDRLGAIKNYYRQHPEAGADESTSLTATEVALLTDHLYLDNKFTGEESLGRYLDLHLQHEQRNNLTPEHVPYIVYLTRLSTSDTIPPTTQRSKAYAAYLTDLLGYLTSFYERALPLGDLAAVLSEAEAAFGSAWDAGTVWPEACAEVEAEVGTGTTGIWCGVCEKSYAKETVYRAHLTSKRHVKRAAAAGTAAGGESEAGVAQEGQSTPSTSPRAQLRAPALKEALIRALLTGPLAEILANTISNTERRSALTERERQFEIEELQQREAFEAEQVSEDEASEDDDDGEKLYNPLKLPLGWDGKPIPYWLYKLHGLGVEYTCEICAGHVYLGRRAFERHFQENRHTHGMRDLGLPNTKHFAEMTRIEDVLALAEKLKQEGKLEMAQAELTEEMEDSEGNVYSRKTWEDLKRQGLL